MYLYRITRKKYAKSPFNPEGARLYGGRWNSKGVEALYFSESESLASLEVFVHVNKDPKIITQYDLYRIELPEKLIARLEEVDLPGLWRDIPPGESTQRIGDEFLGDGERFAALQLPSVISPRDKNYLVNPNHQAMPEIFKASEKLEFAFDIRIFKC